MKLREFIKLIPPEDLDRDHTEVVVLLLVDGEKPLWFSTFTTEELDHIIKTLGAHTMSPAPVPKLN